VLAAQVVDHEAGDLRQVDGNASDRLRRQARELQQRIDERSS
jgi:hypothetical protein